ncbi:hypothetical protein IU449_27750 [Nocardia higoensis]|uniref:Uncharacterized protein n=1 Tax=Nocardia higoensis TaxID=228599 RepID=A0ABS0DIK7_9NOCA|nr:hypothetical protein [Nocardia higoensis]MBF6358297.1 hypothetical protein [Nocardia higoensis]
MADAHGHGLPGEDPAARWLSGTVIRGIRGRDGAGPVVAVLVERVGALGGYDEALRPECGHQPEVIAPR